MDIGNSVFVVTGGGSGLGAATAKQLVSRGAKVLLADVNEDAGVAVAEQIGRAVRFVKTDVTSEDSARSAFAAAMEMGDVRGLVNCAGIAPGEKILGKDGLHKLESFARTVNINLIGSFNMLRFAVEAICAAEPDRLGERGVIVNTASVAAFEGQIGQAGYAASKAGVVGMTLPVAREVARYAIRVMTIAPGIMETPMLTGMPSSVQESLGQMVPFPSRMGKPDEFAALVVHIVENPYLNGAVIRLDGAIRMAPR